MHNVVEQSGACVCTAGARSTVVLMVSGIGQSSTQREPAEKRYLGYVVVVS